MYLPKKKMKLWWDFKKSDFSESTASNYQLQHKAHCGHSDVLVENISVRFCTSMMYYPHIIYLRHYIDI